MLSVREISENIEQETLAPWAAKSSQAVRDSEEAADDLRTAFQRDRDRIIHSTPFRKLKHKTQVYLCPGDHYRTRLTYVRWIRAGRVLLIARKCLRVPGLVPEH